MKFNKKAMTMGFIVAIIITLVAFVLIAGTIVRFQSKAQDKEAEILCQSSIALRVSTALRAGEGNLKLIPPICKTIDKDVKGKKEIVIKQIADKMARCWWMFGEGRYEELLQDYDDQAIDALGFENLDNQCFNCYALFIDEEKFDGGNIKTEEIVDFMQEEKYPLRRNVTYLEYIQSVGGPGRIVFATPEIKPRFAYAISMMPKNRDESDWLDIAESSFYSVGPISMAALLIQGKDLPVSQILTKVYGERDVSSVYVSDLLTAQEMCGSGDIAGR